MHDAADAFTPFDVVTVADLDGRAAHVHEARTLLLLGSWADSPNRGGRNALRVVVIGDPTDRILRLADEVGAEVVTRDALEIAGARYANKLRGLETVRAGRACLLVDCDVLFLGDVAPVAGLGECLAAGMDDAVKFPQSVARELYRGTGTPLPAARFHTTYGAFDLPPVPRRKLRYPEQNDERRDVLPYVNAGVLWVPPGFDVRGTWERAMREVSALVPAGDPHARAVRGDDQAALPIALARLGTQGLAFRPLPEAFNARWEYLYAAEEPFEALVIFHATGLLEWLEPGDLAAGRVPAQLDAYVRRLRKRLGRTFRGDLARGRWATGVRRHGAARRSLRRLHARMKGLCARHVAPCL